MQKKYKDNCKKYYYVKDHLGNIRQTVDENGVIISAQDYSPYGEILRSYNNADANDKYKFTEKERDKETNLDYFGARYYDPTIGRWNSIDRFADIYPGLSPYNYTGCNPLKYIDINGDSLDAGGDKRKTYRDLLELGGSANSKEISINAKGQVVLGNGYKVTKGGGSELLYNLVNSDKKYLYSVGTTGTFFETYRGTLKTINLYTSGGSPLINAVRNGMQTPTMNVNYEPDPSSGYDAILLLSPTAQLTQNKAVVPRTNLVFHELAEIQNMVESNLPRYNELRGGTFIPTSNSAHFNSAMAGWQRVITDQINQTGFDGGYFKGFNLIKR